MHNTNPATPQFNYDPAHKIALLDVKFDFIGQLLGTETHARSG